MKATVSEKGQVTIPKRLRERLGIRPGEALEFDDENGRLVATKASDRDPVADAYGLLEIDEGTDAFLNRLRGAPPA